MTKLWLQNRFDEITECNSLKAHIKEQALHGKCLALNPKDTKRLASMISDWRDELNVPKQENLDD